jgi:hypothetical protein
MAVSFIDGGNRSTPRKPPTCHKSLTNFITLVIFGFAFYLKVQIFKKGNRSMKILQFTTGLFPSWNHCSCWQLWQNITKSWSMDHENDGKLYNHDGNWLIDWCLMPTLAVFQLYRDENWKQLLQPIIQKGHNEFLPLNWNSANFHPDCLDRSPKCTNIWNK